MVGTTIAVATILLTLEVTPVPTIITTTMAATTIETHKRI